MDHFGAKWAEKMAKNTFSRSLGQVSHVRIWHDNSGCGRSGSWFLSSLVVKDLQTGESSEFVCDEWLAVDESDGKVILDKNYFPELNYHQIERFLEARSTPWLSTWGECCGMLQR